jgi:hypothetical protein
MTKKAILFSAEVLETTQLVDRIWLEYLRRHGLEKSFVAVFVLFGFFYEESFVFGVDFDFDFFVGFEWECAVFGDFGGHVYEDFVVEFSTRLGWPVYYFAFTFQHFVCPIWCS